MTSFQLPKCPPLPFIHPLRGPLLWASNVGCLIELGPRCLTWDLKGDWKFAREAMKGRVASRCKDRGDGTAALKEEVFVDRSAVGLGLEGWEG